jgi:dolichol kinase
LQLATRNWSAAINVTRKQRSIGMDTSTTSQIEFTKELIRKSIHFCSLSIPILYNFISRDVALTLLIPFTALFIIVDAARYYHKPIADLFYKYFGFLLRQHEFGTKTKTLSGATYVLISATLCVLIFPKVIVVTSFAILIISDIAAALVGKRFGKHKIHDKSLEGSAAFFVSAVIVVFLTPKLAYLPGEYAIGIVAAFVGMLAELYSFDILDDNLAIPLSVGAVMWLLYAALYPELNVYQLDKIM